jgi:hypothetical protein
MTTATIAAPSVRCGSCKGRHATTAQVFACYVAAGLVEGWFLCTWMVRHSERCTDRGIYTDDGEFIMCGACEDGGYQVEDCGAPARLLEDGTGFECMAGHSHIDAEARQAQGWEYAEDRYEAKRLVMAGVEPRTMDGKIWVEPLPN